MAKHMLNRVAAKLAVGIPSALLILGLTAVPATASSLVANGDFVGAEYPSWAANAGTAIPTPFSFGVHTYTQNFAWQNTGCGCLDWIAGSGSQITNLNAPANPTGYTGNLYIADASPTYDQGTYLYQTLNLNAGQTYKVTFEQAAGDYYTQTNPSTPWTDTAQWQVGLGGSFNTAYTSTNQPYSVLSSGAVVQSSALMNIGASTGTSPWETETLTFKATSAQEMLTFFATGSGAPPFALLANVSVSAVPEPSAWIMMVLGMGIVGFGLRKARTASSRTRTVA